MKHLIKILVILLPASLFTSYAQQGVPFNIPTPNAASLGQYGNIPMSYYTDNPCLTIPLYTTSVRGVEMPITLVHDASGVKLEALPSWTGHK